MKIRLFSGPGCPYCIIIKKYLEKNKIEFEEIDISKDKAKKQEMEKISKQSGVPVLDIDGTIITGYNIKKIKEALKLQ
jgi:glutaredoxin 3